MDVIFGEEKPYFSYSCSQGDNSIREDLLLDLSLLPVSKGSSKNIFEKTVELVPEAVLEPIPKEPRITYSTLRNVKFGKGKVYTRRQPAIPELVAI